MNLTIAQAIEIAEGHASEEDWDLWDYLKENADHEETEISHGAICPNTTECLKYGAFPYLTLCRALGHIECCCELYTTREPHEELSNVNP